VTDQPPAAPARQRPSARALIRHYVPIVSWLPAYDRADLRFDAIAGILSAEGGKMLAKEAAAVDFVRDAFGHLKAIAIDEGGSLVLKAGGVGRDAGVVDARDVAAFIGAAKTRQWDREKKVRTLA